MKLLVLIGYSYFLVLCVQLCCSIFSLAMPAIVGLFVCSVTANLSILESAIFDILIGLLFDTVFPFLPLGFSPIFFVATLCIQKFIYPVEFRESDRRKQLFEQVANFVYLLSLCFFSQRHLLSLISFISIVISQMLVALASQPMFNSCKRIARSFDEYTRIDSAI